MKDKYDLIIFDCDGVLVNSEPLTNQIFAKMITEAGWPMTMIQCATRFNGRAIKSCMVEIEAHLQIKLPDGWEEEYRRKIHIVLAKQVEAVPGILEVLETLEIAKCVASSAPVEKMQVTLGRTGLWDHFNPHIYSATMVEHGKPAPDLFLYAAAQMGVTLDQCLVIEDAPTGAKAARAAGMDCIGYAGGPFDHADGLRAAGAKVIENMSVLSKILS